MIANIRSVENYLKQLVFKLRYRKFIRSKRLITGRGCEFGNGFNLDLNGGGIRVTIGNKLVCRKYFNLLARENAIIEMGNNIFVNNNCSFNCLDKLIIGDNTIFGENVKIYDHNHNYCIIDNKLIISKNKFTLAPVVIGKNCWIGSNVVILKGVKIGDNSIIGANCLIHKSIPKNSKVINESNLIISSTNL